MVELKYGNMSAGEAREYAALCFVNKKAMACGLESCATECKIAGEAPPACTQVNRDGVYETRDVEELLAPNEFVQKNLDDTSEPVKPPSEERVAKDPQWETPIKRL